MWKSAGRAPSLRVFTLAFALQLRKKHGKTSVRVRKNISQVKKNLSQSTVYIYQNTHTLQNPHKHTHYKPHTYTHTHTHKHIYIYNTYDAICEELLENCMPFSVRNMHVAATTVSLMKQELP
jgi:hypothetical protein